MRIQSFMKYLLSCTQSIFFINEISLVYSETPHKSSHSAQKILNKLGSIVTGDGVDSNVSGSVVTRIF